MNTVWFNPELYTQYIHTMFQVMKWYLRLAFTWTPSLSDMLAHTVWQLIQLVTYDKLDCAAFKKWKWNVERNEISFFVTLPHHSVAIFAECSWRKKKERERKEEERESERKKLREREIVSGWVKKVMEKYWGKKCSSREYEGSQFSDSCAFTVFVLSLFSNWSFTKISISNRHFFVTK